MHHHALSDAWALLNTLANIGIVVGYVLVPFTVLRYLPLTRNVMVAGTLFFLTCATTHASMAFDFIEPHILVINHVVQAVAVVWFVLGFFSLLRRASAVYTHHSDVLPIDADGLT
jgi:hypothetical protein